MILITMSIDDEIHKQDRPLGLVASPRFGAVINEFLAEGLKGTARPPARRQLGQLRGTITIAGDFDDTPQEILEALDDPI